MNPANPSARERFPLVKQQYDSSEKPDISRKNAVIHNRSPQGTENVPHSTQNMHRVEGTDISGEKAVIHSQNVPPASENLYPKRENIERKEKEREGVDNSTGRRGHAAHSPQERRSGTAVRLGDCLRGLTEPPKSTVRKERALQILAELRDKLPGDQLLALMRL